MSALSYVTTANLKARLGITDSTDDDLLDDLVAQTNAYVEHVTRRPIGPTNGGTATFDAVEDVYPDGRLYVRQGIRTLTSATVAPSTGESGVAATVADIVILPRSQNRRPDWPGFWLAFKDEVTGSVEDWGTGWGNITIVGDFGWASIPPEISEVAELIATRAWHARASGQQDIVGTDENGNPIVSRFVSMRDRDTLRAYRSDRLAVG